MSVGDEPAWPVDLDLVRLWPMESADGPRLQQLFDDLDDFRTPFGEPGAADAVSTFLALPEGRDYDAKLLLGLWRDDALVGALDCIMGYPTASQWTVGLMLVADRHRHLGIATGVVDWLERTGAACGAVMVRTVLREVNTDGIAFATARGYEVESRPSEDPGFVVLARSVPQASQ